jgi:hypothetical protein
MLQSRYFLSFCSENSNFKWIVSLKQYDTQVHVLVSLDGLQYLWQVLVLINLFILFDYLTIAASWSKDVMLLLCAAVFKVASS